jgi:hypothetical protein
MASDIYGPIPPIVPQCRPFANDADSYEFLSDRNDGSSYRESVWYNNTIVRAELQEIDIEYMDGTTATLKGDELKYMQY